ncbi:MAG TPA: hypothetical protein VGP76_17150 [Planctomycetaceae bacterium]|jgi:hypothetical protein|nr:hypothetical protein [Planctomycetaceae bacterium]
MSAVKYRRTIAVTAFVVSFFGLLLGFRQTSVDNPIAAAALELVFIGWAVAIRWRMVAGALLGLLVCELTPSSLHEPDIGKIVVCMAIGAMLGFALEELGQKVPKPPDRRASPADALPSA